MYFRSDWINRIFCPRVGVLFDLLLFNDISVGGNLRFGRFQIAEITRYTKVYD